RGQFWKVVLLHLPRDLLPEPTLCPCTPRCPSPTSLPFRQPSACLLEAWRDQARSMGALRHSHFRSRQRRFRDLRCTPRSTQVSRTLLVCSESAPSTPLRN